MPVDPQLQPLLDLLANSGAPSITDLEADAARALMAAMPSMARVVEIDAIADRTIAADGHDIPIRVYTPPGEGPFPILVWFHGGGWVLGSIEQSDPVARALCKGAGCVTVSVEYRLAPEHPFPAAPEDMRLAFDWSVDNADLLGIDPARIALAGDSAGGNLAIVTALALRAAEVKPAFLLLIYPSTEIRSARPSRERYAEGFFLDRESLQWFFERYLPGVDTEDWRASPMRAASLAGLPPMQVICAECDPLVDDCLAFVERVRSEGGEVALRVFEGVVHGFYTLGKLIPEAREAVALSAAALRSHLAECAQS